MSETNTRRQPRYQASAESTLELGPSGTRIHQTVRLLDINQSGGMGLFIPSRGAIDSIALTTFLGTWSVTRVTRGGPVSFEVRLFNAIPRFYDGKQGVRISALPVTHTDQAGSDKFFFGMRRKAKRAAQKPIQVRLSRGAVSVTARVLNIGDDDGVGLLLDAANLAKVTWGDVFADGWTISSRTRSLACFLQRVAHQDGGVVLGAVAPGVTRGEWQEPVTPGGAPEASSDAQLLELLDKVLKQKPAKPR